MTQSPPPQDEPEIAAKLAQTKEALKARAAARAALQMKSSDEPQDSADANEAAAKTHKLIQDALHERASHDSVLREARKCKKDDLSQAEWGFVAFIATVQGLRADLQRIGRFLDLSEIRLELGAESRGFKRAAKQGLLQFAAIHDRKEIIELIPFLLSAGCDPNAIDEKETTILMKAVANLKDEPFAALLPVSDVNAQDANGATALMHAVAARLRGGRIEQRIEKLLAAGANPNIKDHDGDTALLFAIRSNEVERAAILAASSDLSVQDKIGKTAMDIAIERENFALVDTMCLLLSAEKAHEVGMRVLRRVLSRSAPRIEAHQEAIALRESMLMAKGAKDDSVAPGTPSSVVKNRL